MILLQTWGTSAPWVAWGICSLTARWRCHFCAILGKEAQTHTCPQPHAKKETTSKRANKHTHTQRHVFGGNDSWRENSCFMERREEELQKLTWVRFWMGPHWVGPWALVEGFCRCREVSPRAIFGRKSGISLGGGIHFWSTFEATWGHWP